MNLRGERSKGKEEGEERTRRGGGGGGGLQGTSALGGKGRGGRERDQMKGPRKEECPGEML